MNRKSTASSVFKIRHNTTGLYSKGGIVPTWGKVGKAWTSRAALGNHLTLGTSVLMYNIARKDKEL